MSVRFQIMFFVCIAFFKCNITAQSLTIDQLINFALVTPDEVGAQLEKAGWKKNNIEFVPDSNFVRRSWELSVKSKGAKSYFLHYEFTKDTSENYIIYQFSDRDAFLNYKKELKSKGYKLLSSGKSKKKKKRDENIHKENEDLFYHEKKQMLTVVKEAFYYGLFSFLVYSYKPGSVMAIHEMEPIKK